MKVSKLALGAVIGAAAGVVAGVLTAPKSGKQTRDEIKQKAGDVIHDAASKRDEALLRVEEVADDVRTKVVEALDTVTSSSKKQK